MTDLAATLHVALRAVAGADLSCALVGGYAVSVRTEPRFTRDVDLAVAVEGDDQAEDLIRRLRTDGHEIVASVEQEAVDRLATVRLRLDGGHELDLLFASSGIEPEVVAQSEPVEVLSGVTIGVAGIGHLIAPEAAVPVGGATQRRRRPASSPGGGERRGPGCR